MVRTSKREYRTSPLLDFEWLSQSLPLILQTKHTRKKNRLTERGGRLKGYLNYQSVVFTQKTMKSNLHPSLLNSNVLLKSGSDHIVCSDIERQRNVRISSSDGDSTCLCFPFDVELSARRKESPDCASTDWELDAVS